MIDDLISRQKAIDALETVGYDFSESELSEVELEEVCGAVSDVRQDMIDRIKQLPSAQPQRIKGHWIDTNIFFPNTCGQFVHEVYCDKCHGIAYFRRTNNAYVGASICPNCGADMTGRTG